MRLSGRSNEYVYGAYVAALRLLASCTRSGEQGTVLEELASYLRRVFRSGEGLGEAVSGVRDAIEWFGGGDCRERVSLLEEDNYHVIRGALYAIAGLELLGAQSWKARQAAIVLGSLQGLGQAQRLSPRGSLLVSRETLHRLAQQQATPPHLRESYYVIEPWRRLEIEHNIGLAVEALTSSGVLVEAPSLRAYIVPAPYLEKDFIEKLRQI